MKRRTLLCSAAAVGTAWIGLRNSLIAMSLDRSSAHRTLASHRTAKIEAKRSNDRYSHFVGRGARGGPTRFGFGREVRIVIIDQGARGGAMSGAKPDGIAALIGQRVSDRFDIDAGTADHAMSIDLPLHDLVGNIVGVPVYRLLPVQIEGDRLRIGPEEPPTDKVITSRGRNGNKASRQILHLTLGGCDGPAGNERRE